MEILFEVCDTVDMNGETVGDLIRRNRKALGLTQGGLADRIKMTIRSITTWERDRGLPDRDSIEILAQEFGIEPSEFYRRMRPETIAEIDAAVAEELDRTKRDGHGAQRARAEQLVDLLVDRGLLVERKLLDEWIDFGEFLLIRR